MHRPLKAGGRPVVVRSEVVGLAHSDHEVVEFLRRAGRAFGEDRPRQSGVGGVETGSAHDYESA
ncbi:hypothetical protein [Streptomyces mirabilis]|uniref:hypothetical protein n=1 Tax=Streptomyces mirabilis TaxID=68239 RepID=UPI00352CA23D